MTEDEVFEGFAWAVPRAFGAAVHACRFEQGDVLYSDLSAYAETKGAKQPARHHIQVLDPPRTTRALGDGEGQRFFSNWESPVEFEWMDYKKQQCTQMRSIQGRLFTCLWKGDPKCLQPDAPAELPRPLLLRDLQSRVDECVAPVIEQFAKTSSGGSKTRRKSKSSAGRLLFAGAIDRSSDASRVKWQSIARALDAQFELEQHSFSPHDLALAEAERFHPALEIQGLAIETRDRGKVEDALRGVLYGGGKAGQEGGRFQLARHGALSELP